MLSKYFAMLSESPDYEAHSYGYAHSFADQINQLGFEDFMQNMDYEDFDLDTHPELFTCVSPERITNCFVEKDSNWLFENLEKHDPILDDLLNQDFGTILVDRQNGAFCDSQNVLSDCTLNIASLNTLSHRQVDFDHCYSAPFPKQDEEEKIKYYDVPSPGSLYSTETSSSEVDVVTVTEERIPIVSKFILTERTVRKRGRKSTKKAQNSLTAKSLKAAMNHSRTTNGRKASKRKQYDSVETSPSNSIPSSAQNSDVEDADKRANHNSSERKRREVLRNYLQNLRNSVPRTRNNAKAPKVLILNSAAVYVKDLINEEKDLISQKNQEAKKLKRLQKRFKTLCTQLELEC